MRKTVCSWCGKPATVFSGYIVFNDLHEEFAITCADERPRSLHRNNPLFESCEAYEKWKLKHPLKSRQIQFQQAILSLIVDHGEGEQ